MSSFDPAIGGGRGCDAPTSTKIYMLLVVLTITCLLLLVFIFWEFSNIVSLIFGGPFDKTPKEQIKKAFQIANLKPNEIVYDLGSGNGRAVVMAALDFKARAFGFEVSPWFYLISLWNIKRAKITKAKIIFGDLRKADLKKADVIYLYLMPKLIKKLSEKFKYLKPNTRIISFKFPIEGLKLWRKEGKIYVYKI